MIVMKLKAPKPNTLNKYVIINTKANTPINFCFSFSKRLINVLVNSDGTLYAYKPLASSKNH
jgi:hypothetical protein